MQVALSSGPLFVPRTFWLGIKKRKKTTYEIGLPNMLSFGNRVKLEDKDQIGVRAHPGVQRVAPLASDKAGNLHVTPKIEHLFHHSVKSECLVNTILQDQKRVGVDLGFGVLSGGLGPVGLDFDKLLQKHFVHAVMNKVVWDILLP